MDIGTQKNQYPIKCKTYTGNFIRLKMPSLALTTKEITKTLMQYTRFRLKEINVDYQSKCISIYFVPLQGYNINHFMYWINSKPRSKKTSKKHNFVNYV